MISHEDIRDLRDYTPGNDSLVLSLYVNTDQARASNLNRGFETAVEHSLRKIAESESGSVNGRLARFDAERQRALRFLRDYAPRGKGLVIFSDSSKGFWWQRELQVEIPTEARWSTQPWLRPLLALLEYHDPLAVVLIDKHRARILLVDASGTEQVADLESDVPGKHQATGTDHIWSQSQMERDHHKHIKWHAKRAADTLSATVDRVKTCRLAIGGPVEATSIFIDELPKRIAQTIIGTLSVPVDITHDKLLAELSELQQRHEIQDELALVESLITSARKGDRAVLGIPDTLDAVNQSRIHRLVIARDFRWEGAECNACQVLLPQSAGGCSFCGSNVEAAPDLINRLSHKVFEQGGKVQTVSDRAAEALSTAGRIGAVLRF